MSKEQIRLVSLGIQSYAGISKATKATVQYPLDVSSDISNLDPDGGVLIVFPQHSHVTLLEADQGRGKTSVITCIREAFGNIGEPLNAVNSLDEDKKYKFRVYGKDGALYEIRGTRSTYVLEEITTEEPYGPAKVNEKGKEIKKEVKSPKETIVKLLGPSGVDPNTLKNMKPSEQVQWIRSLYSLSQEALTLEYENTKKRATAYASRTEANRQHKHYKALVEASAFYADWQSHEQYFSSTNFDNLQEEIQADQKGYQNYEAAKNKLVVFEENLERLTTVEILSCEKEIAELEQKLVQARKALETKLEEKKAVEEKINLAKNYIQENEKFVARHEAVQKKIQEASEFKMKKQAFEQMKHNKQQMDHFADESIRLTHILDACDQWKKEFVKTFTPNIEELEICIPDEKDPREGLFYRGKASNQWCESEAWEVASLIWEQLGIRIIFVENVSSLGSGAVEKLNHFANNGGYIFGSLMNRQEKNLKITITNNLP